MVLCLWGAVQAQPAPGPRGSVLEDLLPAQDRVELAQWLCSTPWGAASTPGAASDSALADERPVVAGSGDGRWTLRADPHAPDLVLLDADQQPQRHYALTSLDGRRVGRVSVLRDAPTRRSFVLSLPNLHELWEISYDPAAAPIYDGLVHDYAMGEALARPGYLGVRRTPLSFGVEDFFVARSGRYLVARTAPQAGAGVQVHLINLDVRRSLASLALSVGGQSDAGRACARLERTTEPRTAPDVPRR